MPASVDPLFWQVARWLLAAVFAAALWHKLRAREAFVAVIDDYRLLPDGMVRFAAASVMTLEGVVLIGLVFGASARPAALLAMALLGIYGVAIAINLARGRLDLDCGCLGPAGDSSGRRRLSGWLLMRNVVLIAIGGVVLVPASGRELLWLDAAGIGAGVTVALLVYFTADQLVANRPLLDRLQ